MFIALMTLGILIRASLSFRQKSFWFDEWASVSVSLDSVLQTILHNARDTHPPFYFVLLHTSIKAFGMEEWAFRLPSFAAGLGVLALGYAVARELFGKRTALLSMLGFALLPFFVHLSYEIRNHGIPVFFCLLGTWAYFQMIRHKQFTFWGLLYALSGAFAVYSDHFAWFWLFATAVFHGWQVNIRVAPKSSLFWLSVMAGLCLPALGLVSYHALRGGELMAYDGLEQYTLLTVLKQMLIVYWHFVAGHEFFMYWNKLILVYFRTSPVFWLSLAVFLAVSAMVIKELLTLFKSNKPLFTFFFMMCFLPVLVVGVLSPTRLETRYFSFSAAFLLMIFIHGFLKIHRKSMQAILGLMFVLLCVRGNYFMINLETDPLHRENYITMTHHVAKNSKPEDAIVGNGNEVFEYYVSKLNYPVQATFFKDLDELTPETAKKFKRIWYLDGLNLDANDFYILKNRMTPLGFEMRQKELRFGWEADYACVDLFERIAP